MQVLSSIFSLVPEEQPLDFKDQLAAHEAVGGDLFLVDSIESVWDNSDQQVKHHDNLENTGQEENSVSETINKLDVFEVSQNSKGERGSEIVVEWVYYLIIVTTLVTLLPDLVSVAGCNIRESRE